MLFGDAVALTSESELTGPARNAVNVVAGHLTDLIRQAQADGDVRSDADPEAAAWLLLSVLSARRLRTAVMPADLEPAVTALALGVLAPPAPGRGIRQARAPDQHLAVSPNTRSRVIALA